MTTPFPNKLLVDPPGVEPATFGLLSVASIREGGGKWEIGGVEYDSDACAHGGYVIGPCATRPGAHDKLFPEGLNTTAGSNPFGVYVRAECNAVGFEEAAQAAQRRMPLVEGRVAEQFFSREVLGREMAARPLGDRSVPLKYAVGVLEHHAGLHYGGIPTLHVPRWAAPYFPAQDTKDTGAVRRTGLGSKVAFGAGYLDDPYDPPPYPTLGQPPGATGRFWLFASGAVRVWRAETRVYEAFHDLTNTRIALGERPYAIDWDCYLSAVLVDVTDELGIPHGTGVHDTGEAPSNTTPGGPSGYPVVARGGVNSR